MPHYYNQGDSVCVPATMIPQLGDGWPSAMYRSCVVRVVNRSVTVSLPDGSESDQLAVSKIQTDASVLICRIGDYVSETKLLDPLAKSVLQFTRLLLPDDMARLYEIRTLEEFSAVWGKHHGLFKYLILIAHGDTNCIKFAHPGKVSALDFRRVLEVPQVTAKTVISLCCKTGYKDFGKILSESPACEQVIAPLDSVHGASASQFCQTLLAHHFLDAATVWVSYKWAASATSLGSHFRFWKNGGLERVT